MVASASTPKSPAKRSRIHEVDGGSGEASPLLIADSTVDSDLDIPQLSKKGTWNGLDDFKGLPWWRVPSVSLSTPAPLRGSAELTTQQVWFIILPMPVFTLAFGGILVPKLNLLVALGCPHLYYYMLTRVRSILSLVCEQYFAEHHLKDPNSTFPPIIAGGDNPQCNIPEVQSIASKFLLVINLITGLLSALIAPKMGKLSDRYGRTRLLALSSCGGIANEVLTIIIAKNSKVVDYRWLIVGGICDGLTGSFTAGTILAHSYIADCTPPVKRAVAVGWIQACLFGGLAFGPLLSGYFIAYTGSLVSFFYVAVGCHAFFILFIRFVTPDSLSKRSQKLAQEKWAEGKTERDELEPTTRIMKVANLFEPLKALWPRGPGTSPALRRNLVALATADTIIMTSSMGAGAVILLYSKYIFDWDNLRSSQFISALSLVRVFALMVLLPIVNYFGRVRPAARLRRASGTIPVDRNTGADRLDLWVLRLALVSDIIGICGYVFVRSGAFFFLSGMLTAFGGLGSATTQAALTKHVPQDRVGQVLGAVGMAHALARVVGPLIFNGIYALTVGTFPQAVFVTLAGLFSVAIGAAFVIRPHGEFHTQSTEDYEINNVFPSPLARRRFGGSRA
jgi:MFS family permease